MYIFGYSINIAIYTFWYDYFIFLSYMVYISDFKINLMHN